MLTATRRILGRVLAHGFGVTKLIWLDSNLGKIGLKSKLVLYALQYCLPFDPLAEHSPVEIELFMPVAEKDLRTAIVSAASAVKHSRNRIVQITFACPSSVCLSLRQRLRSLEDYIEYLGESTVVMVLDEANLLQAYLDLIDSYKGPGKGWLVQQILKLHYAQSAERPVLILDADTVLTLDRTFLGADGLQLLAVSTDAHTPYHQHLWELLRVSRISTLSFVSHHQLMQSNVIRSLEQYGQSLRTWVQTGLKRGDGTRFEGSEYQTYGQLAIASQTSPVSFGSWSNRNGRPEELAILDMPIQDALTSLAEIAGKGIGSISFHSYLQAPRYLKQNSRTQTQLL